MAEHRRIDMTWLEQKLTHSAKQLRYPATPDFAVAFETRLDRKRGPVRPRWLTVVTVVILGVATVMAIPSVRSATVKWIRAGAVFIYELTTGETMDAGAHTPAEPVLLEAAIRMMPGDAQRVLPFELKIPGYPDSLGLPDELYVQDRPGFATVILIWRDADGVGKLALYQIEGEGFWFKSVERIADTRVNKRDAHWVDGPHLLRLNDGSWTSWMLVGGPVLIWTTDKGVTYRLETGLPLKEAVRIAESLHPFPDN